MPRRSVIVSPLAENDLANIAAWSADHFGAKHASAYVDALIDAIEELAPMGPHQRSKARDEITAGMRSLHMAKRGRRGRHLLLYLEDHTSTTVVRILHDSMELARLLPTADE